MLRFRLLGSHDGTDRHQQPGHLRDKQDILADLPAGYSVRYVQGSFLLRCASPFCRDIGITAERFPIACRNTTAPEHMDIMMTFLDTSTLAQRLRDTDQISQEYRTVTGNWHKGRFIVQQRDNDGNPVKVLYTILKINARKELESEYERRLSESAEEARRTNT